MTRKSTFFSNTRRAFARFLAEEHGTTAIEYALIASGIAAVIISIVFAVGNTVTTNLYDKVSTGLR